MIQYCCMDISIVIVSWRVKDLLKKCLDSIYRENINLEFEVFVVDNNSGDGTKEMVAGDFPKVQLIANNENLGFARACNQAIRQSTGNYLLLLNPDTEIIDQAIAKTINYMQKYTKIGITGCKVLGRDGKIQPSVRSFPDLSSHLLILLKLHHFFKHSKALEKYYLKNFNYQASQQVDQVMGAFFMIRRNLLEKIGLLDDNFFIWYEEVDFCRRALNAGFTTSYFCEASVRHQKGQSFIQQTPLFLQLIFNRSMLRYFFKHRPKYEYLILLLLFPVSILLSFIVQIIHLKRQSHEY